MLSSMGSPIKRWRESFVSFLLGSELGRLLGIENMMPGSHLVLVRI
jgi:hypothetical protein